MSFHRENVIWKSTDGTWNRGFYATIQTGDDPEWDVETLDYFDWVSTGHRSEQAAEQSWNGANPGSWSVIDTPGPRTDKLDELVRQYKERS
jgi:hypothetical protein